MFKKTSPDSKKLHEAASETLVSAKTIAQNVAGLLPVTDDALAAIRTAGNISNQSSKLRRLSLSLPKRKRRFYS